MRCFFGLPLSKGAEEELGALRELVEPSLAGWRWIGSERLHLTLSFLGEIGKPELEVARRALRNLLPPAKRPAFKPASLAWFPDARRARVLALTAAARPAADPSPLESLHALVCASLARESQAAGIDCLDPDCPGPEGGGARIPEQPRPWIPHISLARRGPGAGSRPSLDLRAEKLEARLARLGPWPLPRLVLFESRLEAGGPRYLPLEELCLEARSDPS